jgi:hypothetical protein
MSTNAWIVSHAMSTVFWLWVACWGGAERLEGTLSSGCLISVFAPSWSADGLRVFAWLALLGGIVWFVVGLINPAARPL